MMHGVVRLCFLCCLVCLLGCAGTQQKKTLGNPEVLADAVPDDVSSVDAVVAMFRRDDHSVVGVSSRGRVFRVERHTGDLGRLAQDVLLDLGDKVYGVAYNKKRDLLAIGLSGRVVVVALSSVQVASTLSGVPGRFFRMAFSPEGKSLLLSASDNRIFRWFFESARGGKERFWHVERKELERYIGHSGVVSQLGFHPYGKMFISADWDGVVLFWRVYGARAQDQFYKRGKFQGRFFADTTERASVVRSEGAIEAIEISDDGERLVMGFSTGLIEFWTMRGLALTHTFHGHNAPIQSIGMSGSLGYSLSTDGQLVRWRVTDKEVSVEHAEKFPGSRSLVLEDRGVYLGFKDGRVEYHGLAATS